MLRVSIVGRHSVLLEVAGRRRVDGGRSEEAQMVLNVYLVPDLMALATLPKIPLFLSLFLQEWMECLRLLAQVQSW